MSKSPLQFNSSAFGNLLQGQIEQSFQKSDTNSTQTLSDAGKVPAIVSTSTPKNTSFGKKLSVRIKTEYVDLLDKKAYEEGISLNTAINQAIRDYLNK